MRSEPFAQAAQSAETLTAGLKQAAALLRAPGEQLKQAAEAMRRIWRVA